MVKHILPLVCSETSPRWCDGYHTLRGCLEPYFHPAFPIHLFFSELPQRNIRFGPRAGEGDMEDDSHFVPVLIFENSRCLILKAGSERAELKSSRPPSCSWGLNHTGRKDWLTALLILYCDFSLCR